MNKEEICGYFSFSVPRDKNYLDQYDLHKLAVESISEILKNRGLQICGHSHWEEIIKSVDIYHVIDSRKKISVTIIITLYLRSPRRIYDFIRILGSKEGLEIIPRMLKLRKNPPRIS